MTEILITGVKEELAGPLALALETQGFVVRRKAWQDAVLDSVERVGFAAIVSAYPLSGAGFGILLSAMRSRASASRQAGLLLLVPRSHLETARSFLGRGVNRVLWEEESLGKVLAALKELMEVAPRVPVVAPARISLEFAGHPVSALCQTENLSLSGMLIRGCANCRPGMRVEFQLHLDGIEEPVAGVAEIARTTDPEREGMRGFGARFVKLRGDDISRLRSWLGYLDFDATGGSS
ncbi:MAG TPA: hypothetical protein ENK19_12580 [Acidobacteria bacterium]|nr:hypothetical protein [Acidobacteriota bacterium]